MSAGVCPAAKRDCQGITQNDPELWKRLSTGRAYIEGTLKPPSVILAERRRAWHDEAERLRQPNKKPVLFGSFESHPACIDIHHLEAWVLFSEWRELNAGEVLFHMAPMSRAEFEMTYSALPPLPGHAFASRGGNPPPAGP